MDLNLTAKELGLLEAVVASLAEEAGVDVDRFTLVTVRYKLLCALARLADETEPIPRELRRHVGA